MALVLSGCATNPATKPELSGAEAMQSTELSDTAVLAAVLESSVYESSLEGYTEVGTYAWVIAQGGGPYLRAYDAESRQCVSGYDGAKSATVESLPCFTAQGMGWLTDLLSMLEEAEGVTVAREGDKFVVTSTGDTAGTYVVRTSDGMLAKLSLAFPEGKTGEVVVEYRFSEEAQRLREAGTN